MHQEYSRLGALNDARDELAKRFLKEREVSPVYRVAPLRAARRQTGQQGSPPSARSRTRAFKSWRSSLTAFAAPIGSASLYTTACLSVTSCHG